MTTGLAEVKRPEAQFRFHTHAPPECLEQVVVRMGGSIYGCDAQLPGRSDDDKCDGKVRWVLRARWSGTISYGHGESCSPYLEQLSCDEHVGLLYDVADRLGDAAKRRGGNPTVWKETPENVVERLMRLTVTAYTDRFAFPGSRNQHLAGCMALGDERTCDAPRVWDHLGRRLPRWYREQREVVGYMGYHRGRRYLLTEGGLSLFTRPITTDGWLVMPLFECVDSHYRAGRKAHQERIEALIAEGEGHEKGH